MCVVAIIRIETGAQRDSVILPKSQMHYMELQKRLAVRSVRIPRCALRVMCPQT